MKKPESWYYITVLDISGGSAEYATIQTSETEARKEAYLWAECYEVLVKSLKVHRKRTKLVA